MPHKHLILVASIM